MASTVNISSTDTNKNDGRDGKKIEIVDDSSFYPYVYISGETDEKIDVLGNVDYEKELSTLYNNISVTTGVPIDKIDQDFVKNGIKRLEKERMHYSFRRSLDRSIRKFLFE